MDYLFFYISFSIDLIPLMKRFLYIILIFYSNLTSKEQTWTTTTFDYYWNTLLRRQIFREPISFTPFNIKVGQLTYGGSDYWDSNFFESNLGTNLPVILDSTTTTFSIIEATNNRKMLFFEVDFLRINATNYLYHQNYLDIQLGLGYSRMSASAKPELPDSGGWPSQSPLGNTRGDYRFRPVINTLNWNTSISFQPLNFAIGYLYHSIGYSKGSLYESTGGDYYLNGSGISEAFAIGVRAVSQPQNRPFSFIYGIEGRWQRTKFLDLDDPSHISHIVGLDLYAKGIFITFGTIFGGKRTSGDYGFSHLVNQRYQEASAEFENFINDYPNHFRKDKAQEMLDFTYEQIPFQQFRQGLEALKYKDLDSAAEWLIKAAGSAGEDLLFEINSRRKDLAMVLIDSVSLNKSKMTFKQAEHIIQKARLIAPDYPLGDDALAELYLEKGDVLFTLNNFNRAYSYYQKALEVSGESENAVKKKYNDLIISLMDEANKLTKDENYILAIQSLETIIAIHPIRKDDLGPIIHELKSKIKEIEKIKTEMKIKELMAVKKLEIEDKSRRVLLLGMTMHQVVEIIGKPVFSDKIERSGILFEMLTYENNPKAKRLYFEDNLLVRIEK